MVELAFALAVALLVCGVIGSVLPLIPGAALSLAGIYGYWWATGEPGPIFLVAAALLGLAALALDYLGGAISATAGGASLKTSVVAGLVGLALLVVTGPLGALAGVVIAVVALEFERSGDLRRSVRTAIYTTLGMLVSTAMQVVLTVVLLVGFLLVVP